MKYKYGHFNQDGTEFHVTNPATPRAFDNFLWNDVMFSSVHQTGVGFLDYQVDGKEAVKLLTGIGRICDFDVFGRDGLMSRLIYIRDNETGEFWNLNWEPVKKDYDYYDCIHGTGYTIITNETNGIEASFRIFVPEGKDPLEHWTLGFRDTGGRKRKLSVFAYNQFIFSFKWGFNSYGDMLFRKSWFDENTNALIANKHPHIRPHDYLTAFMTADEKITGFDGSRDFFAGIYNHLNEPRAVSAGRCSNTPGSSDSTIGVVQFDFELEGKGSKTIEMILGITDDAGKIKDVKDKYLGKGEYFFNLLKESKKKEFRGNHFKSQDEHLNRMVNYWIRHQTSYGARWCRWGWMGYRDIVQHGYGVSSFNPARTREILVEALHHQYSSGMALRGWNPVDTKPYSDSALWLVFTLISYLKETGDFQFLNEKIAYYDQGVGSVLEHIEQALAFLEENKGSHGLVLIKFGDWNDSLTAIGREGRGESVWLSMAYAEALRQMQELFAYLSLPSKEINYRHRYGMIKEAVNAHAWDGEWYLRCFDDNGKPVGSKVNRQGKIFLNTQSWAMISGIADEDRTTSLIRSADSLLGTEMGYLLLAPTFFEPDPDIGRISCLEPGICENGTVYSHVNVWMILGLLRAGRTDDAYEAFKRITPGYVESENDLKQKMPPYIYANGLYGPDHRNNSFQMEFTWITGSVAWYYNVLTKEMMGVRPEFGGLRLKPSLPSSWSELNITRNFRGKNFDIRMIRKNGENFSLKLNGKLLNDDFIPLELMKSTNSVELILPAENK